jgi:hypothetical protein
MNEFLLFAVIVIYLAICYGRPNSQATDDRQSHQNKRFPRSAAGTQDHSAAS